MAHLIRDRYEPLRVAARGGQGQVIHALDHLHGRLVALKVRPAEDDARREAILQEARTLLRLTPHAGVPLVREDFFWRGSYYLVSDWIEGPALDEVLRHRGRPGLPLPPVVGYLEQVARALDHLHAHEPPIVHRDVKPANIILTAGRGAVLVDFGLSGSEEGGGTPGYVAPEVAAGEPATAASDVYALAATAFVLLTGSHPSPGEALDLPEADAVRVRRAFAAGLAVDPARRPSATAFVDLLRGYPIGPPATSLPGPVATLVFTDIESSTRLFRELGDDYIQLLQDHHRLIRAAAARHKGHEVKTEGDAFFLAFAEASDAVAACVDVQMDLRAHDWPEGAPVRVRMGVHTGEVHVMGRDYVGLPVHEAARICSAAHGGQVLVSEGTAELIQEDLPEGVMLRDLGSHVLKDFPESCRLFQLAHPSLDETFPPPRTLTAVRRNLPLPPTPLMGREQEAARVVELLRSGEIRLVTLTGPGGIGKTRLAIETADRLRADFSGVFFVPLAPIGDPSRVADAVAESTGVRVTPGQDALAALGASLSAPTLLVLDNFEQLAEGASVVSDVLAACAGVKALVTSRESLRLAGEHVLAVPPLNVPLPGDTTAPTVERWEAVRLFVARAQAADPSFAVTAQNAAATAELCRRLDGIPLALEVTAARIALLPPVRLLERLEHSLDLPGARDLPERQRTLRATVAWSYDLLTPEEAAGFRRFAVFRGGATLPAAEAVCGNGDAFGLLSSLVAKSLLYRAAGPGGEPRVAMLETIGRYARERLEEAGEAAGASRRHTEWFTRWAEQAEPELVGPEQVLWLDLLEADHDNLRGALTAARSDAGTALRLAAALTRFWVIRGHWREGRASLEAALALEGGVDDARARALLGAGFLAASEGDLSAALTHFEECRAFSQSIGSAAVEAHSLNQLGEFARRRGDHKIAMERYAEALAIARRVADIRGVGQVLMSQAAVAMQEGNADAARPLYDEALGIMREVGDKRGTANVLNMLGMVARVRGELLDAQGLLEESVGLAREVGNRSGLATALQNLGLVARQRDDHLSAAALWEESLAIHMELGNEWGVASLWCNIGEVLEDHDPERARHYYGRSLAMVGRLEGNAHTRAGLLLMLGLAAARRGEEDEAESSLSDAARLYEELGNHHARAQALSGLADVSGRRGDPVAADDRYREALAIFEELGADAEADACRSKISGAV